MNAELHPQITNNSDTTLDVFRISFESAGALEFINEYSGHAFIQAYYIAFAEPKHANPLPVI